MSLASRSELPPTSVLSVWVLRVARSGWVEEWLPISNPDAATRRVVSDGIAHLEERGGSLLLLEGLQELTGALAGAVVIGECHALPSDAVDAHCG